MARVPRVRQLSAKPKHIPRHRAVDLNEEGPEEDRITRKEHTRLTDAMKESICLFIEQLFQSLNGEEDFHVALMAQKMLRPVSFNLGQAIADNRITLQLEYLNLLSFLMFKTKFARSLGPLNIEKRLVSPPEIERIAAFGEDFKDVSFREEKEGGRKSKMDKKKAKKRRKSQKGKDTEAETDRAAESAGIKLLEHLKGILAQGDFLEVLLRGLNNEHTFVMTKYLEYINKLLFLFTKLFEEKALRDSLKRILFTYLSIIHENSASRGPLQDQEKRKEKVISLLKGMRFFLEQVLQFTHVEIKNERGVEKALVAIFTLGIVSQKEQSRTKMVFKLEESTCMSLINDFPQLFHKLLDTYRPSGLIADPDVYRMLKDPGFARAQVDVEKPGGSVNIKQSISESVLAGNLFETNSVSAYKSTQIFGAEGLHGEDFGVLTDLDFSAAALTSVSRNVFKILNPLCGNFVMKSVEAILTNWANCNKTSLGLSGLDLLDLSSANLSRFQSNTSGLTRRFPGDADPAHSDLHVRILELVLFNNLEPERLLKGVDFSLQMKTIKEERKAFSSKFSSKTVYFWTAHAQREIDVLSFIFAYIKYCCRPDNFFDQAKSRLDSARLGNFSTTLLNLLRVFEGPENLMTFAWVLDVISVFLHKFEHVGGFPSKTRSDWRSFISDLWAKVGKIVSDDFAFEFTEESGSGGRAAPKGVLHPLRPINPSLRAASGRLKLQLAKHFRGNQQEKEKMFDYLKFRGRDTNVLRYKYFLLATLKKSLYQICDFFLSSSKGGSSKNVSLSSSMILQRSADSLQINSLVEDSSVWNLVRLRPLVEKLLGVLKARKDHSLLHQEISEILLILCTNKSFLAEFKQNLLDIFDSDKFFRCDVKTLKMWSRIIDRVLDFSKNSTIVDYYMKNIDFKGVFVFRNTENKKRMKCFLRICFIIYSGDAEKYIDKRALKTLLEKIKNLLKEEDSDPRLVVLILFSLRILIMRLQQSTLNELFRTIWPSIIFLLRKLIKSKTQTDEGIFLASMKLLELISSTDIEEFNLHKWSFMFEYFGVELKMVDGKDNSQRLLSTGCYESKPLCVDGPRGEQLIGFHVNPFLMAQMPSDTLVRFRLRNDSDANTYSSKSPLTQAYNTAEVLKKRKVVITENSLQEIKLEHKIHQFLTYAVQSSRMDIQIDKEDLECVIEKDFIDFGAYLI